MQRKNETDQMIDLVNRNHQQAEKDAREAEFRYYVHEHNRHQKNAACLRRFHCVLGFALGGAFCAAVSLLGLGWKPLFSILGLFCAFCAAVLTGEMVQEYRTAKG